MQFQVPQFIDTEDKLIGGVLTLKQFLYIASGAGVSFIFFFLFNAITWILMTAVVAGVVMAIAFVKINGRPLPKIVFSVFTYYWSPRLYTWQNQAVPKPETVLDIKTKTQSAQSPAVYQFHKKPLTAPPRQPGIQPSPTPREWREENKITDAPTEKRESAPMPAPPAKEAAAQVTPLMPSDHKIQVIKRNGGVVSAVEDSLAATPKDVSAARKKISDSGGIQSLLEKINTTKSILPKREKIFGFFHQIKSDGEKTASETIRKSTGELFEARRVDYK